VLVISHDAFNESASWRSIIVIPLSTSNAQAARGPTAVRVPRGAAGLGRACVALCHQVTTLDRAKLTTRVGTLPADVMRAVEAGLLVAVGME
jgi:mRNA-degrading endonuclease toxin of MazEF toxin-antitoxin module